MAESFRKNGLNVTLIEKADQIFPNVSENLKKRIYKEIENNDVELKLNSGVSEIISENNLANYRFVILFRICFRWLLCRGARPFGMYRSGYHGPTAL